LGAAAVALALTAGVSATTTAQRAKTPPIPPAPLAVEIADYAADDGVARTMAPLHELQLWWDDPNDPPDLGKQLYPSMWPIVMAGYRARGGKDPYLPGTGAVSGSGRVDLRLAVDRSGELYLLSKSDGVIRAVIGASAAPDTFKQAARPEQYRIP
jgi:hypothetical protein